MWSKTIVVQGVHLPVKLNNGNQSGQNASFRKVGVFHQLWAGSVLRFSYLFLVGRIVPLRPRLCKDYLPGQQFKICGAVNKEKTACILSRHKEIRLSIIFCSPLGCVSAAYSKFILVDQPRYTRHVEYAILFCIPSAQKSIWPYQQNRTLQTQHFSHCCI